MSNSLEFDSYLTIRAGLVQCSRFIRAIEQQAGRDVCLAVRPDYDLWITELEYALQIYCEQCGRQLDYDLIGIEAYATKAGARLCRRCYDHATQSRDSPSIGYRGARLAAHGAAHPDLLAGVFRGRWSGETSLIGRLSMRWVSTRAVCCCSHSAHNRGRIIPTRISGSWLPRPAVRKQRCAGFWGRIGKSNRRSLPHPRR